jgi:hypothetical protein
LDSHNTCDLPDDHVSEASNHPEPCDVDVAQGIDQVYQEEGNF